MSKFKKLFWYLCASILVLSLPTFSSFLPERLSRNSFTALVQDSLKPRLNVPSSSLPSSPITAGDGAPEFGIQHAETAGFAATVDSPVPGGTAARFRTRDRNAGLDRRQPAFSPVTGVDEQGWAFPAIHNWPGKRSPAGAPLDDDLSDLEEGYGNALEGLFADLAVGGIRAHGNPFEDALSGGSDQPEPPKNTGNGETGESSGDSTGDIKPAGDKEPSRDGDSSSPSSGEGKTGAPGYNFLVAGAFAGNPSGPGIFRARGETDGSLTLENSFRLSLFGGFIRSILSFSENEKMLAADLNQDGLQDLIVSRGVPAVGTELESYIQKGPGQFELQASTVLYLRAIRSFSLFDFDRDGIQELAVVFLNETNLHVYEQFGGSWNYRKEMVLPIIPALVMTGESSDGLNVPYLYVVDESLDYVVSISSRQPTAFRFGANAPLNHLLRFDVNVTGQAHEQSQILVFAFGGQLIMAQRRLGFLNSFAAFDLRNGFPNVIVGDYAGNGTRQTIWIP